MAVTTPGIVNLSGSINSGGTSQLLVGPSLNRTKFVLCNVDATNDLWFSPLGTAAPNASNSVRVPSNGGLLSFNGDAPGTSYFIYGGTTNQKFTAWADA